jgi:hypothetical protein
MRNLVLFSAISTLFAYRWPSAVAVSFCVGLWMAVALVVGE